MSEVTALPLMVFFGAMSFLLVRSRDVKWWQATLIFLFGIYAALTPVVWTVTGIVQWLIDRVTA
ncbi:hypothetical protein [Streptomyces scopuliridis]|uniref:hypothetical protein n=1 Tax=Streptomyces scopuliridis TaxID=452529 RepID=UPI0036899234